MDCHQKKDFLSTCRSKKIYSNFINIGDKTNEVLRCLQSAILLTENNKEK